MKRDTFVLGARNYEKVAAIARIRESGGKANGQEPRMKGESPDEFRFVPLDPRNLPSEALEKLAKRKKTEEERAKLGLIRPIIHADFKGKKIVAVGTHIYYSANWKTFIDFLMDYPKFVLGREWGQAEITKPVESRHQIMNWYVDACLFQQKQQIGSNGVYGVIPNGSLQAYILLAYDLYLLAHHSAVQEDVISRLKVVDQFQGARYEILVAATCIRAGFDIAYENEKDPSTKHVEFTATQRRTNQNICVEAKSRHREGILGRPGTIKNVDDIKVRVGGLLNDALNKNFNHPLVVFMDLNLPPQKAEKFFRRPISGDLKRVIDGVDKTYGKHDRFNLMVFTNVPSHYGKQDEMAPPINISAILPENPEMSPQYPAALFDLYNAATCYGNVPTEFPKDDR